MNQPSHSPLPWKRGTDGLIFDANDELVTDTCGASVPEGEENQKLIVHAVNTYFALLLTTRSLGTPKRTQGHGKTATRPSDTA